MAVKSRILQAIVAVALVTPGMLRAHQMAEAGVPRGDVKKASEGVGTGVPPPRMESVGGARVEKMLLTHESPSHPLRLSSL